MSECNHCAEQDMQPGSFRVWKPDSTNVFSFSLPSYRSGGTNEHPAPFRWVRHNRKTWTSTVHSNGKTPYTTVLHTQSSSVKLLLYIIIIILLYNSRPPSAKNELSKWTSSFSFWAVSVAHLAAYSAAYILVRACLFCDITQAGLRWHFDTVLFIFLRTYSWYYCSAVTFLKYHRV